MIPKVIHYCWFGHNPLPEFAQKCIASWRKFLPDYEIKEWNEDNFDVNMVPYTAEAYKCKKYAFVSDFARFWILYNYGGIYFDTDVEVIRSIDDIIANGAFMGVETPVKKKNDILTVAPGLGIGAEPNMDFYQQLLSYYTELHFVDKNGNLLQTTVVQHTTSLLQKAGLKPINEIQKVSGIWIYPAEYFNPINITTKHIHIRKNSRTIHHYTATWVDDRKRRKRVRKMMKIIPEPILLIYHELKHSILKYKKS